MANNGLYTIRIERGVVYMDGWMELDSGVVWHMPYGMIWLCDFPGSAASVDVQETITEPIHKGRVSEWNYWRKMVYKGHVVLPRPRM